MKKKVILNFIVVLFIIMFIYLNKDSIIIFKGNIIRSFSRTILEEKRYILILEGVKITLIISIFSIFFGSLLGCLISYMESNNILKKILFLFVKLMQGIPITVMLLITYYVIFASINIAPIYVAIMTFSIYFSAYVSEIVNGAIDSLDKRQIQAAYAIGFNKIQTLKFIIVPQILVYIIPVYKNEVVSIIKLTSVCGYISVMELTKATDIIRNRTYEAFFPLIFTAFIYFLICTTFGKFMDRIYLRLNPREDIRRGGSNA